MKIKIYNPGEIKDFLIQKTQENVGKVFWQLNIHVTRFHRVMFR